MKRLIVTLVFACVGIVSAQTPAPPSVESQLDATKKSLASAQASARQLSDDLEKCQTKYGRATLLIEEVKSQVDSGKIGDRQQAVNAFAADLLKALEKNSPEFTLDLAAKKIVPKKADSGK